MSTPGLGQRLSLWLAWQSLVGLGLVCGALYFGFQWTLDERRDETLAQKEKAVQELLSQTRGESPLHDIPLVLKDLLAGHSDLGLEVIDSGGRTLFSQPLPPSISNAVPTHQFEMAVPEASSPWKVTLQLDPSADQALLKTTGALLIAAALGGTVAISLGGLVLVRRSLAPVRQLVIQTSQISPEASSSDALAKRLDGQGQPAELQPLVQQFNALLNRLAVNYKQMESFNADVAHELNTPLATMISGSQLALRQEADASELKDLMSSHLEELNRLAQIVADMLFLSRAHRGSGARRVYVPSLASLVAEVGEFHEASLAEAQVSLRVEGDAAINADAGLLQRAVSNLLSNAARHARPDSEIVLRIMPLEDGKVQITVDNVGNTIAAEHLPHLFDRFFRADTARAQADRHHGLGLAIVAAIARLHGGGTVARSSDGRTSIGLWLSNMT
ncbi:MAG: two-component sensor histidine kinase [Variovorax paradoxus]|nr:MAG: two-component sensor histidine kinase [Variovorax paradoxus]PZQ01162.1 MAG: two-component sensor histidine kinase [Variovorax paradoxus]